MSGAFFILLSIFTPLYTEPTPLLILKTARSGSSWFTYLLNRFHGIYIREELLGKMDNLAKNTDDKSNIELSVYVGWSLRHPMLKYPYGKDCSQRGVKNVIVGSTLGSGYSCPNDTILPNLVKDMVPNLRVVAYIRSNIVKHAVSHIRGDQLFRKCKYMVVKGACKLEKKTIVTHAHFDWRLISVVAQDQWVWDMASAFTTNAEDDFRVVFYEELIGPVDKIGELLKWIGFNINNFRLKSSTELHSRCTGNCTKNTSDNLRDSIANYEEVESWVRSKYPCLLPQFYETNPGKVQPSVHETCGDVFTSKLAQFFRSSEGSPKLNL